MNKQEIDDMMRHLPSQQPQADVAGEILAGLAFTLFLVMICLL
jgi:hypothetical protein